MKSIMFMGGDMRICHAAERLNNYFNCYLYGFDKGRAEVNVPTVSEPFPCDIAVLPLPASRDGKNINTPMLTGSSISLEETANAVKSGGVVFTSKTFPVLEKSCAEKNIRTENYFEREELIVLNAVSTAEGAVEIALRELDITLYGANVLVTGCGRIAKVLIKLLGAFGADVTVAARKCSDRTWAEIYGCSSVNIEEEQFDELLHGYDVIFNTVPDIVFDKERFSLIRDGCLLIDLASVLCVYSHEVSESGRVKVIWAQSLPGKTAPISAGNIIADTIRNMINEKTAADRLLD